MKRIVFILSFLCILLYFAPVCWGQGSNFVFCQIKYDGMWDPRPASFGEIAHFLSSTTSIKPELQRRDLSLSDNRIFDSAFLYLAGTEAFEPFSEEQRQNLRRYLEGGGVLLIDDCFGRKNYGFDKSVRREMRAIFPEDEFEKVPRTHVLYRSYYLLRTIGGRNIVSPYIESIKVQGRVAVIYSQNDLSGAWARDRIGNWQYECVPGGEAQRLDAIKLMVNIILYSLTGDYKTDTIHEPFIRRKLGG
ncbi:MAG: DUF4159 domain-containing protein [bacterium]